MAKGAFWSNFLFGLLLSLFCSLYPTDSPAHEVVGKVTPLMVHMKRALLLIEHGKHDEAVQQIRMVYDDFSHRMGMGLTMQGTGLTKVARRIDERFGTSLGPAFDKALIGKDMVGLRRTIEILAYLLMLEKFDSIQASVPEARANLDSLRTVFWLGRNYFSYLLEPTLAERDPVEEKRLDRLLDRMLYRLEDGEYAEFTRLRGELEEGIVQAFGIALNITSP